MALTRARSVLETFLPVLSDFSPLQASAAALDLAQLAAVPNRPGDSRETPSEWPQFTRAPEGVLRTERRTVTNPNLTVSAPADDVASQILVATGSVSGTPLIPPQVPSRGPSRRGSPHSLLESLSATRSVPATPLGLPPNTPHLLKTPGTPRTPDLQNFNGRMSTPNSQLISESSVVGNDLPPLSRVPTASYDGNNVTYAPGRDDVSAAFIDDKRSDHILFQSIILSMATTTESNRGSTHMALRVQVVPVLVQQTASTERRPLVLTPNTVLDTDWVYPLVLLLVLTAK